MDNAEPWLLEIRLFTVKPGSREEFDRISREGTIPLMRELGITVVAHGPSLNNDNGYFLLRAFPSEQERVERAQSLYATDEWLTKYDGPVSSMIDDYETAVLPVNSAALSHLAEPVTR
ncbi:hypothetical protein [Amycolatopsis sp. NPDC051071]|uniref:hypothetical protein n=1 Tax=Amycolatopsis sp. NPDC051071 TaxID=3154637 RepID=UPI00343A13F4